MGVLQPTRLCPCLFCACALCIRRLKKEVSLNGAIGEFSELQTKSDYFPTHAYVQNALNKRHTVTHVLNLSL